MTYAYYTCTEKRPPLEIISTSEVPERRAVIMSGNLLEVEDGFPSLIQKLAAYSVKATRSIKGAEYDFVDFKVRVGLSFDKNNAPNGVAVEIEYAPCLVVDDCQGLIMELMERIAAALVPPPQAGQDSLATKAATTKFSYKRVEVDVKKMLPREGAYFSVKQSMLLYKKLLGQGIAEQ